MRKIFIFLSIAFLVSCTSSSNKPTMEAVKTSDSDSTKHESLTYPYMAGYSSDFEIGDAKNAQTLLELYQNWDNNTIENSKNSFADTDTMFFADGNMFAGSRDSLIAAAKKMRGEMGKVVDSIHTWIPLRSKDRNEEWVVIWTREYSTDVNGKMKAKELQETWRFDKNGKINLMYQYAQLSPKMPPPPPKK
jgi:hypothetical protein